MTELGQIVRERRRQLGWTLAQLAEATGCSKAYLSAIENGRLANPPRRHLVEALERALDVTRGQLRRLAEWEATPPKVRAEVAAMRGRLERMERRADGTVNLDALYRNGDLGGGGSDGDDVGEPRGGIEPLGGVCFQVPLINKVVAGYPTDFTDLDFPARVADEYVACPGVSDPDAFAARVVGDSMLPEYRQGDVIVFSPQAAPVDGADCFARLLPDHHTTFKRVYFEPDERIRLQPLNPAFAAKVVRRDEVDGLYPAVYRMQSIGPRVSE